MAEINIELNRFNGTSNDALLPKNSLTGITDPTNSTVGIVGQFYLNTTSEIVFVCVEVNGGSYIWEKSSGLLPQINVFVATGLTVTCTDGITTLTETSVDNTVKFFVPNFGTWTVSSSGLTSSVAVVDTVKIYNVEIVSTVLDDNAWSTIQSIAQANTGANYWAVGDAKQITLSGNIGDTNVDGQSYWVYILGFNHNASVEGSNRIHFGFGRTEQNYSSTNGIALTDGRYNTRTNFMGAFTMNTTNTNSGGWNDCHMRNVILGSGDDPSSPSANTFMSILPSDLRNVLKTRTTYTSSGGSSINAIQQIADYIWLLAEFECFGSISNSSVVEQSYLLQYQYYINGNSRIKYKHNDFFADCVWCQRSPCCSASDSFVYMSYGGGHTVSLIATISSGVAPAFCV